MLKQDEFEKKYGMAASFNKFYGKKCVAFCLNTRKWFFKIALRFRDWPIFVEKSVEILNVLITYTWSKFSENKNIF